MKKWMLTHGDEESYTPGEALKNAGINVQEANRFEQIAKVPERSLAKSGNKHIHQSPDCSRRYRRRTPPLLRIPAQGNPVTVYHNLRLPFCTPFVVRNAFES